MYSKIILKKRTIYFQVLYTHQKLKKAKTWHDGTLKHSGGGTKVGYSVQGSTVLLLSFFSFMCSQC